VAKEKCRANLNGKGTCNSGVRDDRA